VSRLFPDNFLQIFPVDKHEKYDGIWICRKHVYCLTPKTLQRANDVIFQISFEEIHAAAESMHEMQLLADVAFQKKKQKGVTGLKEQARQRLKKDIDVLKRGMPDDEEDD